MASNFDKSQFAQRVAKLFKGNPQSDLLTMALFGDVVPEDLQLLCEAELASLVKSTHEFIKQRKPGRASIRAYNPEAKDGQLAKVTVIELINDDMPFLMDSTMSLLAEKGLEITLVTHPILMIERTSSGALKEIHEHINETARTESLIHVHAKRIGNDRQCRELEKHLARVLSDIRRAVLDWRAIEARVRRQLSAFEENPPPVPMDDLTESTAFVEWLLDNHFTFLGLREYRFDGDAETGELKPVADSGLGILRDPDMHVVQHGNKPGSMTPEIRGFLMQPAPLFVIKADVVANVHRRVPMDYIGLKLYDEHNRFAGEMRIVGLFTSVVYTSSPSNVPLVRKKITQVIDQSGLNPHSHSGKGLLNILEQFPRDELFQIDVKTLSEIAAGILRLEERPQTRVFIRRDKFDRSVSAFVFFLRDHFQSDIRERVGEQLAEFFAGEVTGFEPSFGHGSLIRVHYMIRRSDAPPKETDIGVINEKILTLVRSWHDRFFDAIDSGFQADTARRLKRKYANAFNAAYIEAFAPRSAIADIQVLEDQEQNQQVAAEFYYHPHDAASALRLKLFNYHHPVPLSDLLPVVENMGLKAIDESTYRLLRAGTKATSHVYVHEVKVHSFDGAEFDIDALGKPLEDTFMAVWSGQAGNDRYNMLTLKLQLPWREAALMRALGAYLHQTGIPYSPDYVAATVTKHTDMTAKLIRIFQLRFGLNEGPEKTRPEKINSLITDIETALNEVPSLDEDTIIRRMLNLIQSINRTNYYQKTTSGDFQPAMAFKINSRNITNLPEPRPFAEIFVYSPDVEGVHLRAGEIARGGLRWSDRPQDFRTEVLGLAKAQNVKNAVIVPVGAKGGFVPKKLPASGTREEIFAEGTRAYKLFISSLLQVTDNLKGGKLTAPKQVIRHDGDDPYLVVAADKGTATFSDTANGIAEDNGFWLGDAFASGGSAGYDHKVMGITARGAWEAVKRHFREMDKDIQTEPFTVIGVGDMSGDVFGNGMLLSKQIRLLAAFDHRDIFIDPSPDAAASFSERKRLFETPRTSWQDYDKSLISKGGGVFSRALKSIRLSKQIRTLTGLDQDSATPNELLQAILRIRAELLWFGGIGTYIRDSTESDIAVGDRANDAIRISASELAAKVIGEGANLGLTQAARIEFTAGGGRVNTDAVDNSAGVNSSDVEVNIKIALAAAEASGALTRPKRNKLLAAMTDEVARLCLRNNYLQTLSISMSETRGIKDMEQYMRVMRGLEHRGQLDRKLEKLPDDLEMMERVTSGMALTRPELSVLVAYVKNTLFEELLASQVPDDSYFEELLFMYFPNRMVKTFRKQISNHRLRREIIATMLANSMINRGGLTFISRLQEETGHSVATIAAAYGVARDTFGFVALNNAVDAYDNKITGAAQMQLYLELQRIMRRVTMWFLRNETLGGGLEAVGARYKTSIAQLAKTLPKVLPQNNLDRIDARSKTYMDQQVSEDLARAISGLRYLERGPDIVQVVQSTSASLERAATTYFAAGGSFRLDRLMAAAATIATNDHYERLAVNRTIDSLMSTHRALIVQILQSSKPAKVPWESWSQDHATSLQRLQTAMEELLAEKQFGLAQLAVANSLLGDLATAVKR